MLYYCQSLQTTCSEKIDEYAAEEKDSSIEVPQLGARIFHFCSATNSAYTFLEVLALHTLTKLQLEHGRTQLCHLLSAVW